MKKEKKLLTTGEFAKLACTTKRTIQYYDQIDILKPALRNKKGYRFYKPKQILDFQVILLLTTLDIPLDKIGKYLQTQNFRQLFNEQKEKVKNEIELLEHSLNKLSQFYTNLDKNSTLVNPQIKQVKKIHYYYIQKRGDYAQIGQYCAELLGMFTQTPANPATLAVFMHEGYKPHNAKLRIGIIKKGNVQISPRFKCQMHEAILGPLKAITYIHRGDGSTMSLMWQQTYKYMSLHDLKQNFNKPEFEIYWKASDKPYKNKFELFIPLQNT
jgi:DNA-binding transcriptional MerR regulator